MRYIKTFKLYESLDNLKITDEEKNYISSQIKDFDVSIEYYKNGTGFHIECKSFGNNMNPVTIECEKEKDGIFLQYSQEAEDGYGGTIQTGEPSDNSDSGFTEFVKDIKTLEEAIEEIKKILNKIYSTNLKNIS